MSRMPSHQTIFRGTKREGYWWLCVDCEIPPNQFAVASDAELPARRHMAQHGTAGLPINQASH